MSRFLKVLALSALAGLPALAVGWAQTPIPQPRPATAPQAAPAPAAPVAAAATAPALPWAGSPNAQIMGLRVARSDIPAFPARRLGIGREATSAEIAGWDIDVRPDGQGLRPGSGSVKDGEELYLQLCASCHGDFGESAGRWPILAGGQGSLTHPDPVKSVGSFWPYVSTLIDYIYRAMPYGNAQSLTWDQTYAITAYVLYVNDIVTDNEFVLTHENAATIRLPNERNFFPDDRETTEAAFWRAEPCMTNCAAEPARVIGRARAIDVTPETRGRPRVE